MVKPASPGMQPASVSARTKKAEKRKTVYRRIGWLTCACVLAYVAAHFAVITSLQWGGEENRIAVNVGEVIATALLPLLILVAYGARTYKWGLWLALVCCGIGAAVCRGLL